MGAVTSFPLTTTRAPSARRPSLCSMSSCFTPSGTALLRSGTTSAFPATTLTFSDADPLPPRYHLGTTFRNPGIDNHSNDSHLYFRHSCPQSPIRNPQSESAITQQPPLRIPSRLLSAHTAW